jgi:spermidine/putrescine transport system ATP-binding protein
MPVQDMTSGAEEDGRGKLRGDDSAVAAIGREERADGVSEQASKQPADIEFKGVTKRFGEVVAVDNVSLTVERGAFYTFLGPSGCGKTTSLRLIAGFEQPDEGDVQIGGALVVGVPPYRRPVNMVFQHYALFPHLTVADNIGYGLRQRAPRPEKSAIDKQVGEMLELVRLPGFERRRVWELSIELQTLQREVGITFVLVTHDQEEALSMSDTICIMRDGHIVQTGNPTELYDEPVNGYVADFVGKSNFFAGKVVEAAGTEAAVELDGGRVLRGRRPRTGEALAPGARGVIVVRPELVHVMPAAGSGMSEEDVETPGRIKNRIFLGEHTEYLIGTEELGDILALVPKHIEASEGGFSPGDEVRIGWRASATLSLAER